MKRLRLASFGVAHSEGEMDETTLYLAYSAFVSKKYNRDTLSYLMTHFEGELEESSSYLGTEPEVCSGDNSPGTADAASEHVYRE